MPMTLTKLILPQDDASALPLDVQCPPSLPERFAQQVLAHPEAIAVEHDGISLSYANLDRQADHLARQLRQHGVQA
ncbi:hypothetical protein, partial [Mesorhizobium japonicum]|uniref:hypothetical protein n=1 Tax=Mesorhizobium japonicum TaxID=2066070 RepID=UPI003B5C3EBB